MTLTEFYCCYIPKMLGNARKKITSPITFKPLTHDEMLALALWADLDVVIEEQTTIDPNGNEIKEFVRGLFPRTLDFSIEDGRFTVTEKNPKHEEEANDY